MGRYINRIEKRVMAVLEHGRCGLPGSGNMALFPGGSHLYALLSDLELFDGIEMKTKCLYTNILYILLVILLVIVSINIISKLSKPKKNKRK